jgi:hypothetical protein
VRSAAEAPTVNLPGSTLEGLETPAHDRTLLWVRRGVLMLVLLVVLAGATSSLGVRSGHAHATRSGWTLDLTYARVARSGLDVPWRVTVEHAGGFTGPVKLAVTGGYFDIFETQGFHPEPSAETRDGQTLYLTFDPPPSGDTFVVAYDAYIQPASQVGRRGQVSVIDPDQQRLVTVTFQTLLLP